MLCLLTFLSNLNNMSSISLGSGLLNPLLLLASKISLTLSGLKAAFQVSSFVFIIYECKGLFIKYLKMISISLQSHCLNIYYCTYCS